MGSAGLWQEGRNKAIAPYGPTTTNCVRISYALIRKSLEIALSQGTDIALERLGFAGICMGIWPDGCGGVSPQGRGFICSCSTGEPSGGQGCNAQHGSPLD